MAKRTIQNPNVQDPATGSWSIKPIKKNMLKAAADFCSQNSFAELDPIGIDQKIIYAARISDFISKKKDAYCCRDDIGIICGVILFEKLDFDTALFKIESYKITDLIVNRGLGDDKEDNISALLLDFALKKIVGKGGKFIQAKFDSRSSAATKAMLKKGFFIASEDVTLYKELSKNSLEEENRAEKEWPHRAEGEGLFVSFASEADVPEIYDISKEAYKTTRFHQDPHIRPQDADEMQGLWIKNCFYKKLSDEIIVLKKKGNEGKDAVVGYIACSVLKDRFSGEKKIGRIVLVATHKDHRGTGVGGAIMREADNWFRSRGCTGVAVGTQSVNTGALRYYQKNGFSQISTTLSLHYWP